MRLPERRDLVLWVGVGIALVVLFQQPLKELLDVGRAFQDRYGLALVPSLAVLALVLVGHDLMRRFQAVAERREWDETGQFVRLAQTLNQVATMDQLRELLSHRLPQLVGSDGVWVVIHVDGEWEALAGGVAKTPYRVESSIKTRADRFAGLAPEALDQVHGNDIDGHRCFHLSTGDHRVGVMGLPSSSLDLDHASRVLAPVSAVLGVCIRNVELAEEIKARGVVDGLTKCVNRTHGMKVLDTELQRAKRTRTDFTLIMLDLDHFKSVNDEHGHLCGDALLSAVGRRMHELLRSSDVKVRFGGEEFLIMLPDTPLAGALHVARILNRELGRLAVTWDGQALSRTVSVGVAAAKPGELDTTALLSRVDAALYRSKHAGRDRVCVAGETPVDPYASEDQASEATEAAGPAISAGR